MKHGLPERTIQKLCEVFSHYPEVEKVVLYGSRARGTYKNGSDIDLTLWGPELSHKVLSRIDTELDDLLLPYMIDLSIFSQIGNPAMIQHIQREGISLYEKSDRGGGDAHHERHSFTRK